jgi:preprotein translocase subunit SecY
MEKKIKKTNEKSANNGDGKKRFDEKTEKVFKVFVKTMSWVGGICFLLVLILPEFSTPFLDKVTHFIFVIGAIILLSFLFIELLADRIKTFIEKLLAQ